MKKRLLLMVLSLICVLFLFEMGEAATVILTVKTTKANIRLQPSLESTVITQAPLGAVLTSTGKEGEWYIISLPPNKDGVVVSGYIHQSVVTVSEEQLPTDAVEKNIPEMTKPKQEIKTVPEKIPQAPVKSDITRVEPPRQARPQGTSKKFTFRPYFKVGYLLLQPSATDFGYSSADGDSLNMYLDVNGLNYGGGVQVLLPFQLGPSLRLGLDTGFQKLFSMRFDTTSSDLDFIYEDYDKSSEFEYYLNTMIEFSPGAMPLFIQGGIGMHLVFWNWKTVYVGKYTGDLGYEESGLDFNLGLFGLAGFNAIQTETFSLPIGVRIDYLLRYGSLLKASFVIGFAF
jgi:hypothetical protein